MVTHVTTSDAAQALGTTPDALRKALQRDPQAPQPRLFAGSHLWDLDALIAWDQQRTRRTGRMTADLGRPVGTMAIVVPSETGTASLHATGVATAWWKDRQIRFDVTTLPDRHEITGAATLDGVDDADTARSVATAISRHLTGVSEIGGEPTPITITDPHLRALVDGIGQALRAAIVREGRAVADEEDGGALPDARVDREVEMITGMSERLGGDFGPWARTTLLRVSRMSDWALGDVQRALETALPGDDALQRSEFMRLVWISQTNPADGWPGPRAAEARLQ